jgi:hypothetical protein
VALAGLLLEQFHQPGRVSLHVTAVWLDVVDEPMLLALGLIALVIATLKNVASYREDEFRAVGSSKTMWIILVFMLGWISPVFYFATVHRRLQDGRRQPLT